MANVVCFEANSFYQHFCSRDGHAAFMASPLPLIHLEGDKFVIGQEAAENLRNITQDVAVVSIAGLYR